MPEHARLYDLMIVLSTSAEDERRAKLVGDVEAQITSGGGTIERNDDWHARPMAYEIDHQTEGEYHLLQFTGPTALLEGLSHNLRIDDAVLRFRIIRVVPGTPPAPDAPPPVLTAAPAGAQAAAAPEA
ncbi:MAG TPA: 30S ribosomal protein S6 [Solirubrobacteraceae bacterium]|jgi:small subunit ribosomal protein S6|nr:30S ribosomal protein S6 [Solirubrobacteraceae bacterium]